MRVLKNIFRGITAFLLTMEAKAVLAKYRPRVVLVTGGVGKTLTKNAVYRALSGAAVRRSEKSRSDLSVPLAVLGVPDSRGNLFQWAKNLLEGFFLIAMRAPYPEWLILEASADRPGDIASLSWLKPSVVVATRFPDVPSHVEFFASPEAVIHEELSPVGWLGEGGTCIANADDANALGARAPRAARHITFGFGAADVRASKFHVNARAQMPSGISFDVIYGGERARVSLSGVAGAQHAYPVLAGIAVALSAGVPLTTAAEAFSKHTSPPGRMRLIEGMRKSVIIDDSYNASPVATEEALTALAGIPLSGRRIAVLADMLELGTFSVDEHRRIGALAARAAENGARPADILLTAGVRAHDIARAALEAGMPPETVFQCENTAEAASRLVSLIAPGDVVLVKGSQAMRMERVVKAVMADPERAGELLVRQDRGWLKRA